MGQDIFGRQSRGLKDIAAFTSHGGALDVARRMFPDVREPWLDLSTGINAIPFPVETMAGEVWTRLPDETALRALEAAAARRYGVRAGNIVVAAPGTQTLIHRLPDLCDGHDVRVLGRTFDAFECVFRDAGRLVRIVSHLGALRGADVAVVVNPNNPDGRFVPPRDLMDLAGRVGTLVVDEAFVDALPSVQSVIPLQPSSRMIVLRSFGKIYGLAGLRLGFAILSPDRAEALWRRLGSWAVSGPALALGAHALADDAWLAAARERLVVDAARLMFMLRPIGGTLIGGTPLFSLIAHSQAQALFTTLAAAGILTRPFTGEPNWLRFGFPGTEEGWARLDAALLRFDRASTR